MDSAARARQVALRKETIISSIMNVVLGMAFSFLILGWQRLPNAVVAIDFLPQTMAMTFVGGMISSLICFTKIGKGTLIPAGPVPTRFGQMIWVFGWALVATVVFGGLMTVLMTIFGPKEIAPHKALAIKSVYGFTISLVTIPPIVRMVLGMPLWPFRAAKVDGQSPL